MINGFLKQNLTSIHDQWISKTKSNVNHDQWISKTKSNVNT